MASEKKSLLHLLFYKLKCQRLFWMLWIGLSSVEAFDLATCSLCWRAHISIRHDGDNKSEYFLTAWADVSQPNEHLCKTLEHFWSANAQIPHALPLLLQKYKYYSFKFGNQKEGKTSQFPPAGWWWYRSLIPPLYELAERMCANCP